MYATQKPLIFLSVTQVGIRRYIVVFRTQNNIYILHSCAIIAVFQLFRSYATTNVRVTRRKIRIIWLLYCFLRMNAYGAALFEFKRPTRGEREHNRPGRLVSKEIFSFGFNECARKHKF